MLCGDTRSLCNASGATRSASPPLSSHRARVGVALSPTTSPSSVRCTSCATGAIATTSERARTRGRARGYAGGQLREHRQYMANTQPKHFTSMVRCRMRLLRYSARRSSRVCVGAGARGASSGSLWSSSLGTANGKSKKSDSDIPNFIQFCFDFALFFRTKRTQFNQNSIHSIVQFFFSSSAAYVLLLDQSDDDVSAMFRPAASSSNRSLFASIKASLLTLLSISASLMRCSSNSSNSFCSRSSNLAFGSAKRLLRPYSRVRHHHRGLRGVSGGKSW